LTSHKGQEDTLEAPKEYFMQLTQYTAKYGAPSKDLVVTEEFRGQLVTGVYITKDEDAGMFLRRRTQTTGIKLTSDLNDDGMELQEDQALSTFNNLMSRLQTAASSSSGVVRLMRSGDANGCMQAIEPSAAGAAPTAAADPDADAWPTSQDSTGFGEVDLMKDVGNGNAARNPSVASGKPRKVAAKAKASSSNSAARVGGGATMPLPALRVGGAARDRGLQQQQQQQHQNNNHIKTNKQTSKPTSKHKVQTNNKQCQELPWTQQGLRLRRSAELPNP
jgi:hypothetical protein